MISSNFSLVCKGEKLNEVICIIYYTKLNKLLKVVGKTKITFDELQVIICKIESILNNRPLCYIYDDINDIIITPNILFFGRNLESSIFTSTDNLMRKKFTSNELLRKYINLGIVINEFCNVWRRDYQLEIQQPQQIVKSKGVLPKLKDIVITHDEKLQRQLWKLGQIVELYKSNNSKVRGAKIKVGKTEILIDRPLNNYTPLKSIVIIMKKETL